MILVIRSVKETMSIVNYKTALTGLILCNSLQYLKIVSSE